MSRSLNKVMLIGHIGADPEVRYTADQRAVTTLSIATNRRWQDKQTGDWQEATEWHRTVCFGRLAEIARDYVKKGSRVYVEGQLRTRQWQDQQGATRYTTEVVANELIMLDNKGTGEYRPPSSTHSDSTSASPASTSSANPASASSVAGNEFDNFDDDIPF